MWAQNRPTALWTVRGQDLELALVHNDIDSPWARIPGCTATCAMRIRPCLTQRAARTLLHACQAGRRTRASVALPHRDMTRRDSAMSGGRWRAHLRPPLHASQTCWDRRDVPGGWLTGTVRPTSPTGRQRSPGVRPGDDVPAPKSRFTAGELTFPLPPRIMGGETSVPHFRRGDSVP